MPESPLPYIVSGIIGLIISSFGMHAMTQIMALMKANDEFAARNEQMASDSADIKKKVAELQKSNNDLIRARDDFRRSNAKQRENKQNFIQMKDMLQGMDAKDFESMQNKMRSMQNKWQNARLEKEKNMLHTVFDRFEGTHSIHDGMNESQFTEFLEMLPQDYQDRFKRLGTFHKLSGEDGQMDYSDFKAMMDSYAKMAAEGTDIELEKPQPKKFRLFGNDEPAVPSKKGPRLLERKVSRSPKNINLSDL